MYKVTYYDVFTAVSKWANQKRNILKEKGISVSISGTETISIDLDFANCLAKIVVEDALFAPYRYVSFEALSTKNNNCTSKSDTGYLYFWYDNADIDVDTILAELDKGVEYCITH